MQCSINDLGDDVLAAIFERLPLRTAKLEGGGAELSCRGAVERCCRRWRALALARLPISLTLHLGQLRGAAAPLVASVLRGGRTLSGLTLLFGYEPMKEPWAPLVGALQLPPSVRRLEVEAYNQEGMLQVLPPLSQQLPALESLQLSSDAGSLVGDDASASDALVAALRAWSATLKRVDLTSDVVADSPAVLEVLAALPALESAALDCVGIFRAPANPAVWRALQALGPRLARLCIGASAPDQEDEPAWDEEGSDAEEEPEGEAEPWVVHLLALTACGEVQLYLNAEDQISEVPRNSWPPYSLAGIEQLPSLRAITSICQPPEQMWQCHHLTFVFLQKTLVWVPGSSLEEQRQLTRQLSGLAELRLLWCSFPGGGLPSALCFLPALTTLAIWGCGQKLTKLPAEVSLLRSLRQLAIGDSVLDAASVQAACALTEHSLTHLQLPACPIALLPVRPSLRGLQALSMAATSPVSHFRLLPRLAAAASELRALRLGVEGEPQLLESLWPDLEASLRLLPHLQVLAVPFYKTPRRYEFGHQSDAAHEQGFEALQQRASAAGFTVRVAHSASQGLPEPWGTCLLR